MHLEHGTRWNAVLSEHWADEPNHVPLNLVPPLKTTAKSLVTSEQRKKDGLFFLWFLLNPCIMVLITGLNSGFEQLSAEALLYLGVRFYERPCLWWKPIPNPKPGMWFMQITDASNVLIKDICCRPLAKTRYTLTLKGIGFLWFLCKQNHTKPAVNWQNQLPPDQGTGHKSCHYVTESKVKEINIGKLPMWNVNMNPLHLPPTDLSGPRPEFSSNRRFQTRKNEPLPSGKYVHSIVMEIKLLEERVCSAVQLNWIGWE